MSVHASNERISCLLCACFVVMKHECPLIHSRVGLVARNATPLLLIDRRRRREAAVGSCAPTLDRAVVDAFESREQR